jgi:ring-1,2-phenylacetyl-CoA epoxidase subunit PaaA
MLDALLSGKAKYASVFNYPTETWADNGIIGWLVDGAAIKNQTMLARCSYGPYSRAMVRICAEEGFHMKQGKEMCIRYAQGTPAQRAMVQDALNRWWWPTLMMFGLPDERSRHSETLLRWGIKTRSNDELRQEFVNEMVPEIHALGLTVPDPDLQFDEETGNWIYGAIDWDEFWRVVGGDGPCNAERLGARRRAHEEGAWVRAAVAAYAARQRTAAAPVETTPPA